MFWLKQQVKMLLQNVLLPLVYRRYARRPVKKGSILFADAHHDEIPFSMRRVYEAVLADPEKRDQVQCFICDYGKLSFLSLALYLIRFMKAYATAQTVFICDYYLPAASCRKRPETRLVQLWHSCGLMKKIAYDAAEDIPRGYRGDMYGNYSLLTVSSEVCVPVHEKALRLPAGRVRALGVSRTDYYFDEKWKADCRERFYAACPEARGKLIALWAPTFRGNAAHPQLAGLEEIEQAQQLLGGDWYLIRKVHPHLDSREKRSNCSLPTEELLDVADVLITDYSSVLFDYLIFEKPAVLFAPDLSDYEKNRGFYIEYRSLPFPIVGDAAALADAVRSSLDLKEEEKRRIRSLRDLYCGACDGHATGRILAAAGLEQPDKDLRRDPFRTDQTGR